MGPSLEPLLEEGEKLICPPVKVHWLFNLRSGGWRNLVQQVAVTQNRILIATGLFSRTVRSLPLGQIETTQVTQPSLLALAFGYGDVDITASGGHVVHLGQIADPMTVARAIGGGAAPPKAPSDAGGAP